MNKEQYPEFYRMVFKLANCFGKEINDDVVDAWWVIFKDYDIFILGVAFIELVGSRETMPKPCHIVDQCTIAYRKYSTPREKQEYLDKRNLKHPFGKVELNKNNQISHEDIKRLK